MTELLYLKDTYLFQTKSIVQEIGTDEFWDYVIVDRTIFYPQWWG